VIAAIDLHNSRSCQGPIGLGPIQGGKNGKLGQVLVGDLPVGFHGDALLGEMMQAPLKYVFALHELTCINNWSLPPSDFGDSCAFRDDVSGR
jgi:hypothetical protein